MKRQASTVNKVDPRVKCCTLLIPVIAITITIGIFSLPIIFYYLSNGTSTDITISSSTENTSSSINSTTGSCTAMSWGEQMTHRNHYCTNVQYKGTVCKNIMETWEECATNTATETDDDSHSKLYLYLNDSIESKENEITSLNSFLIHDKECQSVALPFLCQYQFPLHDCTRGIIYTASREDCIDISRGSCAQLWSLAISLGYSDILPKCHHLPYRAGNRSLENTNDTNVTMEVAINITCKDDFIEINSTCIPRCDKFEENTHYGTLLVVYSEIIASLIGLTVTVIIIGLSVKTYKTMFKFPSILVFFQMVDYSIIALLVLIMSMKRNTLMCSSISLIESVEHPTPFCVLTGTLFHYSLLNWVLFWFFHITTFFYQVLFPFHANRMKKLGRNKYICAVMITLGMILPLPPIMVCLFVKEYNYQIHRFPPTLCISYGSMWFYSVTLVLDILVAIGVCLLITVVWVLHQRKGETTFKLSTAEKKIIVIFSSFVVFIVFTLAHISDITAKADKYLAAINNYFTCEAFGYVPGKCDRNEFEKIFSPYMSAISYAVIGLIPLSILNYVFKWEWIKSSNKYFVRRVRTWRSSAHSTTRSTLYLSSQNDTSISNNV